MIDFPPLAKSCDFKGDGYQFHLLNGDLSSDMGTETLVAHELESESLPACGKEDDSAGDDFHRYCTAGPAILSTEIFDPIV